MQRKKLGDQGDLLKKIIFKESRFYKEGIFQIQIRLSFHDDIYEVVSFIELLFIFAVHPYL